MTGRYAKGRVRREDIIKAAADAYAQAGYHQASLRDIARRAGISHAGLLYYFPTKEALLLAVLQRRDEVDAKREGLREPPGTEVVERLLSLAAHNSEHPGIVDLYARLAAEAISPDHPAHEYFVTHYRRARELAAESFDALDRAGRLRDGVHPAQAAAAFIGLMDGLQVQWLADPSAVDMVATLRFFVTSLLRDPGASR